jgi:uncharacterized repeat protein (TIGR03803 family)
LKKIYLFLIILFLSNSSSFAQYSKLLDFAGTSNGSTPNSDLVSDGTYLFGTTFDGGSTGMGTIFKIMPDGSGFVKLLDFTGSNGTNPAGIISVGSYLYGVTFGGGANGLGTLYKIMADGTGYVKLLDFAGAANGGNPTNVITDGIYLYGTTYSGGINNDGTIYRIMPDGSGYVKLLDFTNATNGSEPLGSLFNDGTYLYGMTFSGGSANNGTLYKIMPDGTNYLKLIDFTAAFNGGSPLGTVISDGTFLYGMTFTGGANNIGTIFKVLPDGTGYVKLLDFSNTTNGSSPQGSLYYDGTFLYGMSYTGGTNNEGTLFKIMTDGSGFLKLLDFTGVANGSAPFGSLISDGTALYGMTPTGGTNDLGVIFKYDLTTGIDETDLNRNAFSIFPNPAKDKITIRLNAEIKNGIVTVSTLQGAIISEENIFNGYSKEIQLQNIAAGIYFVKVADGEKLMSRKLIIQ